MTAPAIELEQQAIEAAIQARSDYWADRLPTEPDAIAEVDFNSMQAAISAYLAASGVGRDAERYRWLTKNNVTTLPFIGMYRQDDEQPRDPVLKTIGNGCLKKPDIDTAIDAAIAREGENG